MAENHLKPIRALKARSSDIRSFSQIRALDPNSFFSSLWHSIYELLILNNSFNTTLEIFLKTIYFYPECLSLNFEAQHSKAIKSFTRALNSSNLAEAKKALHSEDIWNLLKAVEQYVPVSEESYIAPMYSLLTHLGVNIIEKADGYEDTPWDVKEPLFTVNLFEQGEEVFLLHPKAKLPLPEPTVPDQVLKADDDSELLVRTTDESLLNLENDDDVLGIEDELSQTPEKNEVKEDAVESHDKLNSPEKAVKFKTGLELEIEVSHPKDSDAKHSPKSALKKKGSDTTISPQKVENAKFEEVKQEEIKFEVVSNKEVVSNQAESQTSKVTVSKTYEESTYTTKYYSEEVKITEKTVKYSSNSYKIEEETKITEKVASSSKIDEEPPAETSASDTYAFCGGYLCVPCSKELNKTSHILVNSYCCGNTLNVSKPTSIPEDAYSEEITKSCMTCSKKITRTITVDCACCFLHLNVWKTKKFERSEACAVLSMNKWVDTCEGKPSELAECNFCGWNINSNFLCYACTDCQETVCITCLRMNPYIADGICNNCNSKRKIALVKPKGKASRY